MFTPFLPIVQFHLKMCKFFKCDPCYFTEKSKRFVLSDSKPRTRFSFRFIFHSLYLFAMAINLILVERKVEKKYQGTIFLIMFFVMYFGTWCPTQFDPLVELFNCLLAFEKNLLKGKTFSRIRVLC